MLVPTLAAPLPKEDKNLPPCRVRVLGLLQCRPPAGGVTDRALGLDEALEWNLKEQHIDTTGWKNLKNTALPVQIIDTTRLHSSYRSCEHAMPCTPPTPPILALQHKRNR